MWNGHVASAGKNHSTITRISQSAGYTFSLAQIIGGDAGQQLLLAYHHRTLDTKAPFVLPVPGNASVGLTVLGFLYSSPSLGWTEPWKEHGALVATPRILH
ncbi:uncharacterized protein Z519_03054 [Cladophialophora bantiana CBS 173.52]|uniref:Uncharacterized protein n=1 Tax=Cladophialophora bantiana (strain ATCC 10958 / CBS 173.52 / CDC B-1940 / NIH 8579) TaxID=1442370 RepID=A0A0D2HRB2_CLAB1|nr:uncharacterized protein Z519_03054 [Cladophialophora bantiana CBS 173.52]KIW95988.1 hypothetical protein Z519_03054 [Cladophialophora bantiana CBS 173.52]